MARFADSHCHLADAAFDGDRDEVIGRAWSAGCELIACIGESIERAQAARRLADSHPGRIVFTAGVHPHDAAGFDAARDIPAIEQLIAAGAAAIGECGLDYHYDNSPRAAQRAALGAQLDAAARLRKPLVVHSREAVDDTREMLAEAGRKGVTGVMHCFTGPEILLEAALAAGWYISFAGVITFRKWEGDDLIRRVPAERLLAESDAPYLAPVPYRGKRNEPSHVALTVQRLAQVRGEDPNAVGESVLRNAHRFFGVAKESAATR